jgi:hypothetical protein
VSIDEQPNEPQTMIGTEPPDDNDDMYQGIPDDAEIDVTIGVVLAEAVRDAITGEVPELLHKLSISGVHRVNAREAIDLFIVLAHTHQVQQFFGARPLLMMTFICEAIANALWHELYNDERRRMVVQATDDHSADTVLRLMRAYNLTDEDVEPYRERAIGAETVDDDPLFIPEEWLDES